MASELVRLAATQAILATLLVLLARSSVSRSLKLLVIAAIVYFPPLQRLIGTAPFPAWLWLPLVAVAPTLLLIDEIRKAIARRRDGDEEIRS